MSDQIKEKKKQRKNELNHDLGVLFNLAECGTEATIRELEEKTSLSFDSDILPIIHKYDLYIHVLNHKDVVWKTKITNVISQLEKELENIDIFLRERSVVSNPNPWVLNIVVGIVMLIIGFILGSFLG